MTMSERKLRRGPTPGRAAGFSLIVGGAGFIGSNLADRIAAEGGRVVIFDNLSRPGVERNAAWLRERHGARVRIEIGDLRDPAALERAVQGAERVFHLAAQTAVTTSLLDPVADFEINARGTLNLLEALRRLPAPPPLVFTSTNKVYGGLEDVVVRREGDRYVPLDGSTRAHGVGEDRPLAFLSPYGCSKGTADQYVLDYGRVFELPTAVFRMSCIFGPRQFGTEDQGWVAHFVRQVLGGQPITVFGDGMQVRDVLYVGDLVNALLLASTNMDQLRGRAFNIGGGPRNAVSLLDVLRRLGDLTGRKPVLHHGPWRPGDQRFYVSDTRRFGELTGWQPSTDFATGLARLVAWLREQVQEPELSKGEAA